MDIIDQRKIKGELIAQEKKIVETPKGYIVPSQSGKGFYLVYQENGKEVCTCSDYKLRQCKCKHQWAVEYFQHKVIDNQGNTTTTGGIKVMYTQNWNAYNTAQTNEVRLFDELLRDLVQVVNEPEQIMGRPKLPLKDVLFCAIQKVYSQLSSRRAYSLYGNAFGKEQISKAPNFNAINKLLVQKEMTPILQDLLSLSALPLKSVERDFASDSSGFRTTQFNQYAIEKYGIKRKQSWVKAHILTGVKTNIIASALITDENANDCPIFQPLVLDAHNHGFEINEIFADKGYLSRANYQLADDIGVTAYIPFKTNTTSKSHGCEMWRKMYHYFQYNKEEFMKHYHLRSNVESTFFMVKAKFGDKLKSKTHTAQVNELLCKFIAHNIVVLIHEMYELGIVPQFCSQSLASAPKVI